MGDFERRIEPVEVTGLHPASTNRDEALEITQIITVDVYHHFLTDLWTDTNQQTLAEMQAVTLPPSAG